MVFTVCFAVLLVVIRQPIFGGIMSLANCRFMSPTKISFRQCNPLKLMLTQDEVITAMEQQLDTIPDTFIDEEVRRQYIDKLKEQIVNCKVDYFLAGLNWNSRKMGWPHCKFL